jgi:hypothetical protein
LADFASWPVIPRKEQGIILRYDIMISQNHMIPDICKISAIAPTSF